MLARGLDDQVKIVSAYGWASWGSSKDRRNVSSAVGAIPFQGDFPGPSLKKNQHHPSRE